VSEDLQRILHREEIELAGLKQRGLAFVIDELLLSLLLIVAMWDTLGSATTGEEMILLTNQYIFEFILMKIAYQTFFVMQYGATIGKLAVKIKIITTDTLEMPGFATALNRAVFRVISEMLFYMGFLWGIMDPMRQTWHDKTAKTLVVNA
jgi:uncharacterized RDD family membrane protein YckC